MLNEVQSAPVPSCCLERSHTFTPNIAENPPRCKDTLMLIHIIIIEVSVEPVCVFCVCVAVRPWGIQMQRERVFSARQTLYFHLLA